MSQRYKVLQLCAVGFTVQRLLLPLIDEMSKTYDVTIACSRDKTTDELMEKGYKIHNIEIDRKINPISNLKTVLALYKYMRQERFDILHVHTPVAAILGRIAARMAGVPIVIYTAHGFYFHDNMSTLQKAFFIGIEKLGGLLSDYIFTQSTEDYHTAVKRKIIKREHITAIGNGIDIDKFDIARVERETDLHQLKCQFGISDEDIVIGIIGRVVKEKGYMEWARAAKEVLQKHKNVKFLAVGDTLESDRDGIKSELDAFIKENNLKENIIFTGSRNDVPCLLAIMDIFTLPSYREGMPRSIIEAMSMSKPVVATNIRGCREEVTEGITGFLVPVKDYTTLSEKIIFLIEHPELREEMGKNARKKAEKEYNEKTVIAKQLEIIDFLLKQKQINLPKGK